MRAVSLALVLVACGGGGARGGGGGGGGKPAVPVKGRVIIDEPYLEPILFADEKRAFFAAIGESLAAHGWPAVPEAEMQRVTGLAREGRRLADGARCGAPTAPESLFPLAFSDARWAWVSLGCARTDGGGDDCTLTVEIAGGPPGGDDEWQPVARFEAPVESPAGAATLLAAAARLQPVPPPAEGGLGGLLGAGGDPPPGGVRVTWLRAEGPWGKPPSARGMDRRLDVDHCRDDRSDGGPGTLHVEVLADGTRGRCEPARVHDLVPPGFDCLCRALAGVRWPAAEPGRRYLIGFSHDPDHVRDAAGRLFWTSLKAERADDDSVLPAGTGISESALRACLDGLPLAEHGTEVGVRWEIDADGRTTGVALLRWPGGWGDARRTCVESLLRTAAFACPQAGQPVVVTGRLTVGPYVDLPPPSAP